MSLSRSALRLSGAACVLALALASALPPLASPASAQAALGTTLGGAAGWQQLTPAEQKILLPLRDQWAGIEPLRRQKWRDIAAIYPTLPAEQQERLRSRMAEWAKMTPAQRNAARLHFGEVRQVPATERQARWEAWQQLPEEQRRSIGTQAASTPAPAGTVPAAVRKAPAAAQAPQVKSNIVAAPVRSTPQPVAPGTVQAGPGARHAADQQGCTDAAPPPAGRSAQDRRHARLRRSHHAAALARSAGRSGGGGGHAGHQPACARTGTGCHGAADSSDGFSADGGHRRLQPGGGEREQPLKPVASARQPHRRPMPGG